VEPGSSVLGDPLMGIGFAASRSPETKEPAFAGSGDKVIYAFTKALRRVTRPTCGRCSNLVTSKTFLPTLNEQRNQ